MKQITVYLRDNEFSPFQCFFYTYILHMTKVIGGWPVYLRSPLITTPDKPVIIFTLPDKVYLQAKRGARNPQRNIIKWVS